ncbi:MAG TPA: hypothetical protein VK053_25030 [Jiangellaceae bacterium]|nr:hypothetical protein [Jiangellaceae bacterium]
MTRPSVRRPAPDGDLIASWIDGWMRLVDLGDGTAAVTILQDGQRVHVADATYGEGRGPVRWTEEGEGVLEQYKRDSWDARIYAVLARWQRERS